VTLLRLVERTDARVLREHWNGGGDVMELIKATSELTAKLLPKRIRRILTSSVEVAPDRGEGAKGLRRPLLVVQPEVENKVRATE
jgi:hypothetical protein